MGQSLYMQPLKIIPAATRMIAYVGPANTEQRRIANHAQIIGVECENNTPFCRSSDVHLPVWLRK